MPIPRALAKAFALALALATFALGTLAFWRTFALGRSVLQSGLFRHPPYRPIGAGALPTFNREPHSAYLSNRTPLLGAGTKTA